MKEVIDARAVGHFMRKPMGAPPAKTVDHMAESDVIRLVV